MKFIISEDKIYNLIMKHLNSMFDVDNINSTNGTDDYGNEVDYGISFYNGDYDDDDNLFRWYGEDYWRSEEVKFTQNDKNLKKWIEQSPILEFDNNGKKEQLDNLFGDRWHQPFKDWFQQNFDLPIKTIE